MSRIPERRLRLLDAIRGQRILELGCGAGWWSIALALRGARVVGLDFSERRIEQARARSATAGAVVRFVRAPAERIPSPDGRFDAVISDYGATTFADPYRTMPEVARVLRPGGCFIFAHASPVRTLTQSLPSGRVGPSLRRNYFDLHALRFGDTVEFQLPYSEWIRCFAANGLAVERLVEPPGPPRGRTTYLDANDLRWARRWPIESIWKVRKAVRSPAARRRVRSAGRTSAVRSAGLRP